MRKGLNAWSRDYGGPAREREVTKRPPYHSHKRIQTHIDSRHGVAIGTSDCKLR